MNQDITDTYVSTAYKLLKAVDAEQFDKLLDCLSQVSLPEGYTLNVQRCFNPATDNYKNFEDDELPF